MPYNTFLTLWTCVETAALAQSHTRIVALDVCRWETPICPVLAQKCKNTAVQCAHFPWRCYRLTPFDLATLPCQASYLDRFSPMHWRPEQSHTHELWHLGDWGRKCEYSGAFHSSCNYSSSSILEIKLFLSISGGNEGIYKMQQHGLAKRKKHDREEKKSMFRTC